MERWANRAPAYGERPSQLPGPSIAIGGKRTSTPLLPSAALQTRQPAAISALGACITNPATRRRSIYGSLLINGNPISQFRRQAHHGFFLIQGVLHRVALKECNNLLPRRRQATYISSAHDSISAITSLLQLPFIMSIDEVVLPVSGTSGLYQPYCSLGILIWSQV